MIKSSLFNIGVLATLGGFGYATLLVMANGMADAPNESSGAGAPAILGVIGIAMCVGAWFL